MTIVIAIQSTVLKNSFLFYHGISLAGYFFASSGPGEMLIVFLDNDNVMK